MASQKKPRKPQQRSQTVRDAILSIVGEYDVMTVRQLYYQMEMRGYVGKTDDDYNKVQYHCLQLRRDGSIPYGKIRDSSRERRTWALHGGMKEALERWQQVYRRDYWQGQPTHVEIWCEKDALSGVLSPVCAHYGVTFCAIRGFDSESFAYESAEDIKRVGKPANIYYFGDHDPSGWWIARNLQGKLREFGADVTVHHMGVHPGQIQMYSLPTRRAKRTDKRLKGFIEYFGSDLCTELDAVPPRMLGRWVEDSIRENINWQMWNQMERVEQAERETLANMVEIYGTLEPGEKMRLAS